MYSTYVFVLIAIRLFVIGARIEYYGDHIYLFETDVMFWQDADPYCKNKGGFLVMINDGDENYFINEHIAYDTWIGIKGSCIPGCSGWRWVDGTIITYNAFSLDFPVLTNYRDFVAIRFSDKKWRNERSKKYGGSPDLSHRRHFICEFLDPCLPSPCQNGGNCSRANHYEGFLCNCNGTGYTGETCDLDINECNSSPCAHGSCINNENRYFCNCTDSGYYGEHCESDIDECADDLENLCLNGLCQNTNGSFNCTCYPDWSGKLCNETIDDCESSPCPNNSTCVDGNQTYSCFCDEFSTGRHCDIDIDECVSNEAVCNTGQCRNENPGFFCICNGTGFEGDWCHLDINECTMANTVCHNSNCTNIPGSYRCDCHYPYTGTDCNDVIHYKFDFSNSNEVTGKVKEKLEKALIAGVVLTVFFTITGILLFIESKYPNFQKKGNTDKMNIKMSFSDLKADESTNNE